MAKDNVDTRVVRMEFDNKQFEKNIKQTSKSLNNFKRDLDFKGVGDSLEQVKVKFSAMQVAVTTVLVNLTNRLIQLGSTLIKSLSVDNIYSGWAKFGEKTTSVATMMAQKIRIAGQEITDLAKKTEVVNEQLELLTWFSDETSYSFTDMVNNVGKFIAAGQDLDVSVKAMEGIATWAAKAGQNSQTASRAMYQLAQAMGKGKIQKIDWMSIQNANMDTEDFRETILATAVAMGELSKEGDKFITKTGKKFTQSQFADFLSEGWFTSDVLVKGLSKYSAAVEQIYEIANREGLTASEVMEKYADQLDEFGLSAFKAAQEARTFADVLNSIKDAVSSKWMQTFENIFGGKEEAVKLWTELANELYDVFAESGNFRNDILAVWNEFGGRDDIFGEHGDANQGAFWNLYDAIIAVRDLIKKAWNSVFPLSQMENTSDQVDDIARKIKDLTKKIKDFTYNLKISEDLGMRLSKVFQVIFTLLKGGVVFLKAVRFLLDPIIELGKRLIGQVLDQTIYSINKLLKVGSGFESVIVKLQNVIVDLIDSLNISAIFDEVFNFVKDIYKIISDLHPLESVIKYVEDFIKAFKEAGATSDSFRKIINAVLSVISLAREMITATALTIIKYLVPILDDVLDVLVKIAGFILGTGIKIISIVAELITNITEALRGNADVKGFTDGVYGILEQIGNLAKSIVPLLMSLVKIVLQLVDVILLLPKMLDEISKKLTGKGIIENLVGLFDGIINAISNFVNGIQNGSAKSGSLEGLFNAFMSLVEGLWEVIKGLMSAAQLLFTVLGNALKKIGLGIQYIANIFIKVFSGKAAELTNGEKAMLGVIAALGVLAVIGVTIYNLIWLITSIFKPLSVLVDSLTGTLDSLAIKLKVGAIEVFADALLKAAISITLLSSLPIGNMWSAVGALVVMSSIFIAFLFIIKSFDTVSNNMVTSLKDLKEKLYTTASNSGLGSIIRIIQTIGSLMLKMALAMYMFKYISWDDWNKGMATFGILVGVISLFYVLTTLLYKKTKKSNKVLDKNGPELKKFIMETAVILIALKAFAGIIKMLGQMDTGALIKGVLGLTAVIGLLVLMFAGITSAVKNLTPKRLENLNQIFKTLSKVLLAVGFLTITLLMLSLANPANLIAAALSLSAVLLSVIMSVMLLTKVKNNLKEETIEKTMGILIGVLVAMSVLVAALAILARSEPAKLLAAAGSLTLLLAALIGSVLLLQKFGGNDIGKTMLTLGAGLAILAVDMTILALALRQFESLSLETIGKGFLVIAGSIAVLGVAAALLKSVAPVMLLIASSLLIVGVATLTAGLGLKAIAEALVILNQDFTPALENLSTLITNVATALVTSLLNVLPNVIGVVKDIVEAILVALTNLVPRVFELVGSLLDGLLELLNTYIPKLLDLTVNIVKLIINGVLDVLGSTGSQIVETVVTLLDNLLKTISEHMGSISQSLMNIIKSILSALSNNIGDIVGLLGNIIVELLNSMRGNMNSIVKALVEFISDLITNLFNKLGPLVGLVLDYVIDFIGELMVMLTKKALALAGLITKVVLIVLAAVIRMTIASLGALNKLFITFIASILLLFVHTFIGMTNVLFSVFKTILVESLRVLYKTIVWATRAFFAIGKIIFAAIGQGILNGLVDAFSWLIDLIPGLRSTIDSSMAAINAGINYEVEQTLRSLGGGVNEVKDMITQASSNINDVVSMTSEMANEAMITGLGEIGGAVSDTMNMLETAMSEFGEDAGGNLIDGLGSENNINDAEKVGKNIGTAVAKGYCEETETHSPSRLFARFGRFLMQGLSVGIEKESSETEKTISDVIEDSLRLATDILEGKNGDDYTIKVGMDISSVESQSAKIQDIMSGVNNPNITISGRNAGYNAAVLSKNNNKGSETVNNDNSTTVTFNNTFNIESSDPQQTADEIDKVLKEQNNRYKLAHGT